MAKDERLNDIKDEMLKILFGAEVLSKAIFYDKKLFPTLNNNIEKLTKEGAKEVLKMLISHKVGLLLHQTKK